MDSMKNIKKLWMSSLSFLEHNMVYSIIVFVIVIYTLGIFDGINSFIGGLYNYFIIRLIVILLIIWIAPKDPTLAILLALSYAVSLQYMSTSENFIAPLTPMQEEHRMKLNPMQEEHKMKLNPMQEQYKMNKERFAGMKNSSNMNNSNMNKNKVNSEHPMANKYNKYMNNTLQDYCKKNLNYCKKNHL